MAAPPEPFSEFCAGLDHVSLPQPRRAREVVSRLASRISHGGLKDAAYGRVSFCIRRHRLTFAPPS
jgi:hypothetical protein